MPPSLNGETYVAHFISSYTAKSDVSLFHNRIQFPEEFRVYKSKAENHFSPRRHRISKLRAESAPELTEGETDQICRESGIQMKTSVGYASESNVTAERLIKEHWTRARTLLYASNLDFKFSERLSATRTGFETEHRPLA